MNNLAVTFTRFKAVQETTTLSFPKEYIEDYLQYKANFYGETEDAVKHNFFGSITADDFLHYILRKNLPELQEEELLDQAGYTISDLAEDFLRFIESHEDYIITKQEVISVRKKIDEENDSIYYH